MKYLGSKIIETERTKLRPTIESDLITLWKMLGDKELSKYYLVGKYNVDWEQEKKWQYKKLENALNMNEQELKEYYNKFNENKRLTRRHGIVEFKTSTKYINKYLKEFTTPKILILLKINTLW